MAAERLPRGGRGHLWLLLPACALAALWIAWRCLAPADFLYPVFYDWLGIDAHIAEFAPQNRYKSGFEDTSRDERLRLFSAIVTAIEDSGRGLESLQYRDADGRMLDRLLRAPEIGHLQDVANLVDKARVAGWIAVGWSVLHLLLIRMLGWQVPSFGRLLGASVAVTAAGLALVMVIGPKRVSSVLHELVFPPEHPWFFYYQDSLMSTMMKAPDLFGAIALALLALALVFYAALLRAARACSLAVGTVTRDSAPRAR